MSQHADKSSAVRIDMKPENLPLRTIYIYPCPTGHGSIYASENCGIVGGQHQRFIELQSEQFNTAEKFMPLSVANFFGACINMIAEHIGPQGKLKMKAIFFKGSQNYQLAPFDIRFLDTQSAQNLHLEIISLFKGDSQISVCQQDTAVTTTSDESWLQFPLKCLGKEFFFMRYNDAKSKILRLLMQNAQATFRYLLQKQLISTEKPPQIQLNIKHPYLDEVFPTTGGNIEAQSALAVELNKYLSQIEEIVSNAHLTVKKEDEFSVGVLC